jgi:hypothetical protein
MRKKKGDIAKYLSRLSNMEKVDIEKGDIAK